MKKNEEEEDIFDIGATEIGEDATKYGEFVSSYFAWISLPKQKENAKRMENITKGKEKEEKHD